MERMITVSHHDIDQFLICLKQGNLTKQQIKTLRRQALAGDLTRAQKGLMKAVSKNASN
jgi:hypothetical protein